MEDSGGVASVLSCYGGERRKRDMTPATIL